MQKAFASVGKWAFLALAFVAVAAFLSYRSNVTYKGIITDMRAKLAVSEAKTADLRAQREGLRAEAAKWREKAEAKAERVATLAFERVEIETAPDFSGFDVMRLLEGYGYRAQLTDGGLLFDVSESNHVLRSERILVNCLEAEAERDTLIASLQHALDNLDSSDAVTEAIEANLEADRLTLEGGIDAGRKEIRRQRFLRRLGFVGAGVAVGAVVLVSL